MARRNRQRGGGNQGPPRDRQGSYPDYNGDSGSVDNATTIERYSSRDRQLELRRRIEAQDLPVREQLHILEDGLESCLDRKGMLLLQGETGSGKSVYSPVAMRRVLTKRGLQDRTVMLQPRKDATSGVARATSAVMGEQLGRGVGFSTSEARTVDSRSALAVVTPGIFLRYLMRGDLTKEKVGAIIVDEMHEGSIDYHLALGLIKMMHERGDAPLTLLTSATMHKEQIQQFFGIDDEDYLRIEGRAHPVDKHYQDESQRDHQGMVLNYMDQLAKKVKSLCKAAGDGDILVFLPGGKEIRDTINRIGSIDGVEVLPLYGQLGPADRDKALSGNKGPGVQRRVIVATNIAETSITVPGIKVVVDSCRQRSVRYNPTTGIIEMGTEFISRDQAEQRAGRAGRITAGECYRMVTEGEFAEMRQHPESEISRTNLANLVLRLKRLGIDPEEFPFIEPPKAGAIAHGIAELTELGAMTEEGEMTRVGREMGELPFEPRIGRMIVEAKKRGCIEAALILAAFERESNVLLGPSRRDIDNAPGYSEGDKRKNARNTVQRIQDKFDRGNSDLLKALNIFSQAIEHGVFEASDRRRSSESRAAKNNFRRWCRDNYLKAEALTHIAYKLRDYARYARVRIDRSTLQDTLESASDADLGAVILSGHPDRLLYSLGNSRGLPEYRQLLGARATVNMSPGSEGFDSRPQLCVASRISEGRGTSRGREIKRNYASGVHPIGIEQLREVMPHLVVEQAATAHYNSETDQVESQVTFYPQGTTSVELGKESRVVEGEEAVRAFAQALVYEQVDLPCVAHNKTVIQQLDILFHRSRGQVQKPENMAEWYVERLSGAFRKSEATYINDQLQLRLEDFYPAELSETVDAHYPEIVAVGDVRYEVSYSYKAANEQWSEPERFSASITINPEDLFVLEQSDVPTLGVDDTSVELTLRTKKGWSIVESTSIDELKEQVDEDRIREAWKSWEEKPEPREIMVVALEPLPTKDELGEPMQYTQTWQNEPVYAYPALTATRNYDYDISEYVENFSVRYYRNQEEADAENQSAVKKKVEIDAKEQRRLDRETMMEPAQARVAATEEAVADIRHNYSRMGIDYNTAYDLGRKFDEAKRLSQEKDSYGRVQDADPRRAIELCDEIQIFLDEKSRIAQERELLLPAAEALRDDLSSVAEEVLNNYNRYGLSYEEYTDLSEKWRKANKLIDNDHGDVQRARELMEEVRTALQSEKISHWASPIAMRYREIEGSRYGIYAKITIQHGHVYNVSGDEVREFRIGESGRSMEARRGRDGKARLQAFYSSRNSMSNVITLPDGSYAISRDADNFFRVDLDDEGRVIYVHEEIQPEYTNERDLLTDDVALDTMAAALGGVDVRSLQNRVKPKRSEQKVVPIHRRDPERQAREAREYQQAEIARVARIKEMEEAAAAQRKEAEEAAAVAAEAAREANRMTPEARESLVAQLRPFHERIKMMKPLVSDPEDLTSVTAQLTKLMERIERAQGIKKVTKEVSEVIDDIEIHLSYIVSEEGWPNNWQERRAIMLDKIIPALRADSSIALHYDPEKDYNDMMEAVVLDPAIADDVMEEEFLGYYA